jgi:hypothetical protein
LEQWNVGNFEEYIIPIFLTIDIGIPALKDLIAKIIAFDCLW